MCLVGNVGTAFLFLLEMMFNVASFALKIAPPYVLGPTVLLFENEVSEIVAVEF